MKKKVFSKIFVWKIGVRCCKLLGNNVLSVLMIEIDVGEGFAYNVDR